MKLIISFALIALCGCVTRTITYSDGSRAHVANFPAGISPSVTLVSTMPAGSTNWTAPQVISGPGLVPAAAGAAIVVVPFRNGRHGGENVNVNNSATGGSAAGGAGGSASVPGRNRPPANRPPNRGH